MHVLRRCPECKGEGAVDYGMAGSVGEALREACDTCGGEGKIVRAADYAEAVAALQHIAESAEHPSLTVRTTEYLGHVAREWLKANGHPTTTRGQ